MKHFILFLFSILILSNAYAYDFYCVVEDDAYIKKDINKFDKFSTSKFNNKKILVSTDEVRDGYMLIKNTKEPTYISISDITILNQNIVENIFNNHTWMFVNCIDALLQKDSSLIVKYTGDIKKFVNENPDKMDFPDTPWYHYIGPVILKHSDGIRYGVVLLNDHTNLISLSLNILQIDSTSCVVYIERFDNSYNFDIIYNNLKDGQIYNLTYKIDGDYLNIFYNGKKVLTFVNADETLINAYTDFIKENNYSLNDIIWPHHADGTSEYEDTIRYPDPIVIEEPEEIEVEEYNEPEKNAIPPFPDEKDPNYLEIIKEYYPNIYEDQLERFEYLNKIKKIKILVISITSVIIMLLILLFIIIKNKRKSNKL